MVHRSEPIRYVAVPHSSLLDELRDRFNADLESAAASLDRLPVLQEPGLVWSLNGRDSIIRAFGRAALNAKSTLFAGVWDEELDELSTPLEEAAARGVETHVAIYGTRTLTASHIYSMAECGASARLRLLGRRLAVVVADDTDSVVAEFGDQTPDEATVTTNPVIALLAVEYVKADVSGSLMINAMPPGAYRKLLGAPAMQAIMRPIPNLST